MKRHYSLRIRVLSFFLVILGGIGVGAVWWINSLFDQVIFQMSLKTVPSSLESLRYSIYGLLLSLGLLFLGGMGYLVWRFYKPIALLAQAYEAMAQGDLDYKLPHDQSREFDVLFDSFEHMRYEIQEKMDALQDSEERFFGVFKHAPVGFSLVSPEGYFLQANDAFCEMLGYTREELLQMSFVQITYPDDLDKSEERLQALLQGEEEEVHLEKRFVHKNGRNVWCIFSSVLQWDMFDEPTYFISQILNISTRKLAEQKIFTLNHQLATNIQELENSNHELEQFAYVASHDLQAPLRLVINYAQFLQEDYKDRLDKNADEYIQEIVAASLRMQNLIRDLLLFSKAGSRHDELSDVDCEAILHIVKTNLRTEVEESGATIEHDQLPHVKGNETQLTQLFQNLVGNALKYRGEEVPKIYIAAKTQEHGFLFSVHDNGIGISPDYTERIFLIFQRLHTRQEYSGTGIGLAICKKIVERHGGRIWVESQINGGSTFHFTIPGKDEIDE